MRLCGSAHPRSRGENTPVGTPPPWVQGSSPLTRGKPRPAPTRPVYGGLIPAHAGKTQPRVVDGLLDRAHPRSRGENPDCGVRVFLSEGSSPLTRGKPLGLGGRVVPPGLIPAHAGKTRQRASHTGGRPAHPRSRGENAFAAGHDTDIDGSSPLTRGKRRVRVRRRRRLGLIPAHAGKTNG